MKIFIGTILSLLAFNVNAALIDHGTYIEDEQGTYWLKLSETSGQSYTEVLASIGQGGALDGWSFASWNQTRNLYQNNFGLDLEGADFAPTQEELNKITVLNSYMGDLMADRGDIGEYSGSFGFVAGGTVIRTYYYNHGLNMADSTSGITNAESPYAGSVLFRLDAPVVPIPSAIWLFGSGLIGLIGLARRKA